MKKTTILLFVLIIGNVQAQQSKNIFLDRDFWKKNPTIEIIKQKIEEGNDPSQLNNRGFDAVTYAILNEASNTVIEFLLQQKGNDVNKRTHDKRTYIFWAGYKGNVALIKTLIAKGAKLNIKDSHLMSPLTFTAAVGQTNYTLYDTFIANGIDIKTDVNGNGANALLLIFPSLKKLSDADYFIKKGLRFTDIDNDGNGIFNYVVRSGNKELLAEIIKKDIPYKNLNKKGENAMFFATRGTRRGYHPLEYYKYLESLGIAINIVNKNGETPLHNLSYRNNNIKTLTYFISKGININQADNEGYTALLNASAYNSLEVVKLFAEKTKDINHTNKKGQSALTRSFRNIPKVISYLINKGADITVTDLKGNHLAYYLIDSYRPNKKEDFKEKVKILTQKGFDFTIPQKNGNTLYHLAIDKKNIDLLKEIESFHIDINTKNNEGLTVLHKAVMTAKNLDIIKYLLQKGADKSIKTDFDETVYDLAKENEVLKGVDISFLK